MRRNSYSRTPFAYIILAKNCDLGYPPHYHGVFELFIVKKGKFSCFLNGEEVVITDNCIMIFDHYDLHYFPVQQIENTFQYVMTIPSSYLVKFNKLRGNRALSNHLICDEVLCNKIISVIDEHIDNVKNEYRIQAAIDLIFSLLFERLNFTEKAVNRDFEVIKKTLKYGTFL